MSSLLQERIRRVTPVGMFLDGLQEEGVACDPLHRHHQEETQRGGVYVRPGEVNINKEHDFWTDINNPSHIKSIFGFKTFEVGPRVEQQKMIETYAEVLMTLTISFQSASLCL